MKHLEEPTILTDAHHAILKHRSCESQLIITVQDLAIIFDNTGQTDIILLDFSKAFDKVPHRRLMHKLHHYRIRGSHCGLIKVFLNERTQHEVLGNGKSNTAPVYLVVPQGSVMGPTLLLL